VQTTPPNGGVQPSERARVRLGSPSVSFVVVTKFDIFMQCEGSSVGALRIGAFRDLAASAAIFDNAVEMFVLVYLAPRFPLRAIRGKLSYLGFS